MIMYYSVRTLRVIPRPFYLQLFLANHHVPTAGGRGDAVASARPAEEG